MGKLATITALSAALAATACGTDADTGTDAPTDEDYRYSGPGSHYGTTLSSDGTFHIEIADTLGVPVHTVIDGTYDRLPTGFLEMTVTSATGPAGEAPQPGDQAYALEVPGFALVLRPLDGEEVIPMLISDACPTDDFVANWIIAQQGNEARPADDPEREWFGTFEYSHGTPPSAAVTSHYNLTDLAQSNEPSQSLSFECADGIAQIIENGETIANMWMTDGGAIVETFDDGDRNQTIFGMKQAAFSTADLAGDYAALVLSGDSGVFPAAASFDSNGAGEGFRLSDVATGEADSEGSTFQLSSDDAPSAGWVVGTVGADNESGNLACSALANSGDSGRTVLFCIGQSPGDTGQSFTAVLVSND